MSVRLQAATCRHPEARQDTLRGIDLHIDAGEQVAIIGSSGAGKSTLLHMLATALQPSAGRLQILEQAPWQLSARQRQRLRSDIGLIQQAPPLPPRQRVVTAVAAGRLGRWSGARALANLVHPLDAEGVARCLAPLELEDKLFARCDQLSGGQLQRVAIARTLYQQARLILADEPVAALDPRLAEHSLTLLCGEARRRSATLVVSLHAVELARRHFPRVIGLRRGEIVFDGPPTALDSDLLAELYAQQTTAPETALPLSSAAPGGDYPCR